MNPSAIVHAAFGISPQPYSLSQVALRALLVYIAAVILMRVGDRRFLGHNAGFDVIFGVIIGSVFARGITGSASIGGTLVAGAILTGVHWLFAFFAFHSDPFGRVLKGEARPLIRRGELQWTEMRKANISLKDLVAALHVNGHVAEPTQVGLARLERSGEISVIGVPTTMRVCEVRVEAGVQTVRLELV